ncbi:hypothetical protein [Actinoplanes siamensis]|uniref:Uncharacterized protein n=1 Tax=Actinoplanes siamensis TaxID=1223317 RepID=A0A919NDD9_9ACTN|nr:hypothetical protein [Actinoplanes siamensis]GIF08690.1 hypothetical protein Asi03nite_62280 [Actinoplanes siamensis]
MRSWRRRLARLLDRIPGQCRADLKWWAQRDNLSGGSRWPWSPTKPGCVKGAILNGRCYCGKLRAGRAAERGGPR